MLCATNRGQYERACYMPRANHDLRPEKGGFIPRADQDESLQCSGVGREFVMFGMALYSYYLLLGLGMILSVRAVSCWCCPVIIL